MALYADPSYVPDQALFVRSYSQRQLKTLPQSTQDVEKLWTTFSISSFCTSPPIRYTPYFICDEANIARTVRMLADLLRADDEYEAQCASCGFDIAIIVSEFFLLGMQNPTASLTAVKAIKDLRVRPLYDAMRRIGMTVFREVWKVVYKFFYLLQYSHRAFRNLSRPRSLKIQQQEHFFHSRHLCSLCIV